MSDEGIDVNLPRVVDDEDGYGFHCWLADPTRSHRRKAKNGLKKKNAVHLIFLADICVLQLLTSNVQIIKKSSLNFHSKHDDHHATINPLSD